MSQTRPEVSMGELDLQPREICQTPYSVVKALETKPALLSRLLRVILQKTGDIHSTLSAEVTFVDFVNALQKMAIQTDAIKEQAKLNVTRIISFLSRSFNFTGHDNKAVPNEVFVQLNSIFIDLIDKKIVTIAEIEKRTREMSLGSLKVEPSHSEGQVGDDGWILSTNLLFDRALVVPKINLEPYIKKFETLKNMVDIQLFIEANKEALSQIAPAQLKELIRTLLSEKDPHSGGLAILAMIKQGLLKGERILAIVDELEYLIVHHSPKVAHAIAVAIRMYAAKIRASSECQIFVSELKRVVKKYGELENRNDSTLGNFTDALSQLERPKP